jgi:predicted TIM-barrel fold metal-dependent hydrolase
MAWARQAAGRRLPERDPNHIHSRVSVGQSDPSGDLTIKGLDAAGVAAAVIPVIDWTIVGRPVGTHLPIRELNRRNADLGRAHPGRLYHLAGCDPRHPDAADIVDEALEGGARGLKLYPAAGWTAADPTHSWLYQVAIDRGVAVAIHTSPLGGDPLDTSRSRPSALAPVLQAHPELTLVFAHAGIEAWWQEALDVADGWMRTYLDISLWQSVARRSMPEFRARMTEIVSRLGAHRVIFGSDIIRGPSSDPDGADLVWWLERFCSLAESHAGQAPVVTGEELDLMLGGNAVRIYKLDEEPR